MRKENEKFEIQDKQYLFPYHYIPHFDKNGTVTLTRKLNWGLDYLCYQKHLNEKVKKLNPASVLEVGCGDGYFLGGLPSTIERKVGVDLSEKAIAFAKAFHPDCEFHVQDAAEMDEKFDLVAAIEVIEHIPEDLLPHFMKALAARVKDDGIVLITVPTTVIPLNKKHYRHYTLEILENQLKENGCGLEVKSYEYIYSQPWWFGIFKRFFDNRLFSLEFKPFMKFAWHKIWNKYRFADESNGFHLVAVIGKLNR
jgi:SAM-dependent methyltransferase